MAIFFGTTAIAKETERKIDKTHGKPRGVRAEFCGNTAGLDICGASKSQKMAATRATPFSYVLRMRHKSKMLNSFDDTFWTYCFIDLFFRGDCREKSK